MIRFLPLLLALAACRGEKSEDPPVHLIRNMISQPKFDPSSETSMFGDKRTMRPLPPGTVAQGSLKADDFLSRGKNADGSFAKGFPFEVDLATVKRGQERFNIYCTPCHSPMGDGKGIVAQRGLSPPPTSLHEERIRNMPEGEIFNTITNGVRTMPSYATQIPEHDRWAIISYVRALERSQNAKLDDVPESERSKLAKAEK
jgi:mono/diheme cytochrome c family protein